MPAATNGNRGEKKLASSNRVIGVVLLCAHPRNAVYVAKWTFMCPLCGSKMGRLGALLGQFCRCWGHEVPCWRCFGQGGPGLAWRCWIWGMPGFVGAALKSFALQALDSARLALFCRKHGAFMWVYVGFCGCFRGGLLCVFMWVTLSEEAKINFLCN